MIHQLVQLRQCIQVPALAPPVRENHRGSNPYPLRGIIPSSSEIACITYYKTNHHLLQLRRPCRISHPVTFPRHSLLSTLLLVPQLLSLVMDPYRVPLPRVLPRYQPLRNRCTVNRSPVPAMLPMPSKGLSNWRGGRSSRSRPRRKEQEDDTPPPTPDKDVHTSQAPAPSTSRRPETPKTPRSRSTRREESQSRSRPTTTLSYSQSISNFYSAPGTSRTPIYGHPTLKTSNSFRATPPFSSYHSSIGSGKGKMIASSMVHSGVTYA